MQSVIAFPSRENIVKQPTFTLRILACCSIYTNDSYAFFSEMSTKGHPIDTVLEKT
jgi:hypothetical protein